MRERKEKQTPTRTVFASSDFFATAPILPLPEQTAPETAEDQPTYAPTRTAGAGAAAAVADASVELVDVAEFASISSSIKQ